MNNQTQNNIAFIDAANLFYGGVKSLGWKIDYQKLLQLNDLFNFLQNKYKDSDKVTEVQLMILEKNIKRIKFYLKLQEFGYILKYLISQKKEIIVLSRNERTAKEIRQLAKGDFRDFHKLRHKIEFFDKKRERPTKDLSHV